MSNLELKLKEVSPNLFGLFEETKKIVSKLLQTYIKNFPLYTDHSIEHTEQVLKIAGDLLTNEEINNLNGDELYVLCMASILHDVGMCIPEEKITEISKTDELIHYRKVNPDFTTERYIRDIHHILSMKFIIEEWETLKIPSEQYAKAIGLVAQGHRKVDINDFEIYDPQFFVRDGRDFVCLPYLACILRIADELDISNLRTPELLCKYYIPDNEISKREWNKHKSTIQVNYKNDKVLIKAKCTDHNILAALEEQFDKIKGVINHCQKIIRSIQLVDTRRFGLMISGVNPIYDYIDFDPKGIKYTFEVKNVINAFIGEDLYENSDAALREGIQNAVDACNYKKSIKKDNYKPEIRIHLDNDYISIDDNGQGMDEFIIENYFGKLASSFYQQDSIKDDFEAIGQFGIGVFSYFLISNFIDVETKRIDKTGLKFRTDKDPNGYFHFFENFKKENEGTKITLNLKDEYKAKYTFEFLSTYIKNTFPFIDIPIFVSNNTESCELELDKMSVNFEEHVLPHMYYKSHHISENLKFITASHNCEKFEGVLGVIIPDFKKNTEINLRRHFDYALFESNNRYRNSDFSKVSFSQKGVFINDYSSNLSFTFGKMNIIEKLKVNLSRTSFNDQTKISTNLNILESKLISKVFEEIKTQFGFKNKDHQERTNWFIKNYMSYYYNFPNELKNVISKDFSFKLNYKDEILYYDLNEIRENFSKIVVMFNEEGVKEHSNNLDVPCIKVSPRDYWNYRGIFEKCLNYTECIIKIKDDYFLQLESEDCKIKANYKETIDDLRLYSTRFNNIESDLICINIFADKNLKPEDRSYALSDGLVMNLNHPFVVQIFDFHKKNKLSTTERRLIKEAFGIIAEFYHNNSKRDENEAIKIVSNINSILLKIKGVKGLKLEEFKIQDFISQNLIEA